VLSAADMGAPHLRKRVFIVAHANSGDGYGRPESGDGTPRRVDIHGAKGGLADANLRRCEIEPSSFTTTTEQPCGEIAETGGTGWWQVEPNVGRVADGIPSRVDRLRCLGNAVVPQCAQTVGEMILDAEYAIDKEREMCYNGAWRSA
jgi:DNA (cytosine-5)-methyltransferase 1